MALNRLDEHFLKLARLEGQKSTLQKTKRGCIVARGNKILTTGTSTHMGQGQIQEGQLMHEERYIAVIQAEIVAVGNAIKSGINIVGATFYISDQPNWQIFKILATCGIKRIVFYGPVTSKKTQHYANLMGVQLLAVG
jgi:dCMP deaminase